MKRLIKKIIQGFVSLLETFSFGRSALDVVTNRAMNRSLTVNHKVEMKFCYPNSLNYWRVKTFSTKEPETLEWIEQIEENSVLWDIGANVGLYSLYAAKLKNCRVFSFEPSIFNLELLARNIWLNNLSDKVTIIPLPLTDSISINKLNMTSLEWGGALSTFGKNYGHDGKELNKIFEFSVIGMSMDDVVTKLGIQLPQYIKMDVDGIEQLILKGGKHVLSQIKEISVEINEDFKEQFEHSAEILSAAGLVLKDKRHSDLIDKMDLFRNTYNQIWVRKKA